MKSGRISYPDSRTVLTDLGEKVVRALTLSIQRTRRDLAEYRSAHPQWVADHSERGLANWIHDRMWAHLRQLGEGISSMTIVESGITRELTVGLYRFRVKRHGADGVVSSYATPTFVEFMHQPADQLPTMEETNLVAGYDWIKDERAIGTAVISLWDGKDNLIWLESLADVDDDEGGGTVIDITPDLPLPTGPTIEVPEGIGRKPKETTEES